MNIMIDYDGTYTADVDMWRKIIYCMKTDHEVFLVTSRDKYTPLEDEHWFKDHNIPVIYCDYRAKRKVCEERGIAIDIWIDNDPYYIDHGFVEEDVKRFKNEG